MDRQEAACCSSKHVGRTIIFARVEISFRVGIDFRIIIWPDLHSSENATFLILRFELKLRGVLPTI